MNQPTVLVTGATGDVGRPLIEGLLAEGARVRALTRNPAAAGRSASRNCPPETFRQYATRRFPAPVVEDLLRNWARSVGRTADMAPDLEKIIGRPATTYAQWAARHADAYR
jgi:uncharacterized protein YbjT (DUF2867 family)